MTHFYTSKPVTKRILLYLEFSTKNNINTERNVTTL